MKSRRDPFGRAPIEGYGTLPISSRDPDMGDVYSGHTRPLSYGDRSEDRAPLKIERGQTHLASLALGDRVRCYEPECTSAMEKFP